ncbi:MAG TPA: NAD-dependent epimerase/dehydratase family protein [Solirubrobacterales bacterium]|nr:NAD-dependent epimerase/dehydratase family protein [Solirubrobacterales bacterium]
MADERTAFVTGASGFVGGALAESLLADGWRVRALARSDGAAAKVAERGAEPVRGDLDDPGAIAAGADGCRVAFHAAALPAEWGSREEFERANVQGTGNALAGCREAGVERFVHVGTEAACFDMQPLVDIDETEPLKPGSKVLYSSTKARAEQLVVAANAPGFETVTLRPRLVWGPGDPNILPGFADAVETGRFTWVGDGRHLTSTTHIDNCVHGLRLAAERGRPGEAYYVTDGEPVRFRRFITDLLATRGVTPPDKNTPRIALRVLASTLESAWRAFPFPGDPPITRLAYFLIANEVTIDISKAREELGYEPRITVEEGLAALRKD